MPLAICHSPLASVVVVVVAAAAAAAAVVVVVVDAGVDVHVRARQQSDGLLSSLLPVLGFFFCETSCLCIFVVVVLLLSDLRPVNHPPP